MTERAVTERAVTGPTRLGMITPSLNTVLEPLTYRLLAELPDVTAHFARVRVTQVSLDPASSAQFELAPMLEAARLLADARVDAICWNGTAGSWLGLAHDRTLCAAITQETGIPATSASLALHDLLDARGITRLGLVTPFQSDVQRAIIARYEAEGLSCVAEAHLDSDDGFGYAAIPAETTRGMIREVAGAGPEAVAAVCTNFNGADHAAPLEAETGIPVFDSVAVALWGALVLAGVDPARITGWGQLFTADAPARATGG